MFFEFICSIDIGYINSAAYIPTNLSNTVLYNGTCSQCICQAFILNKSSMYQAVNCYLNNNTCLLVKNFTSSSYIHTILNSKLALLQSTIDRTAESCVPAWSGCAGSNINNSTNCCPGYKCIVQHPYWAQCVLASSLVNTTTTTPSVIYINDTVPKNASTGSFWGCCKPSCAWSGKGSVSNPVQTCQKDGNTSIDINTPSGCNSGDAYICTNQQPWSVNDTLSYGFAGVYIKGKDETQWCCACYSLTFTAGSIAGKKMIVQAVDTLYTSENLFTLLIPGGGWTGTSNGCERQYNNTYYWGNQNDGLTTRSNCANLPIQLQSSCYWRFDWFQNTYRPSVSWTEVSCPSVLTSLTGCVRY